VAGVSAPRILVWFWSGGGGGSQYAVRLARRLGVRFGAENVALSLRADDPTQAMAQDLRVFAADVMSDRKRPISTLLSLARSSAILRDHVAQARADVVLIAMNFAVAAPLSRTLRKPFVYFAHDPIPHPGDYATRAQIWTQRDLIARAKAVVALSQYGLQALASQGVDESKLQLAPLGAVFEPAAAPPQQQSPARLLLLGRMLAYKGLDVLLDALPAVADRPDWRLTIAGAGNSLDAARARLTHPQISLRPGWLSDGDIDALFASHDVLLAPYVSATQSGVVAEAMARGMPVIATRVGALAEQIGDGEGGWLCAPDGASFGDAVTKVLIAVDDRRAKADGALRIGDALWQGAFWDWLGRFAARG
jgi:glycosyltransferase involved in cell wall biosynthesis